MKDAIMPQKMYKDRHTITLGGHRVELIHSPYPTHTTDNTMMYFPAEKVLVAADVILIRRAWQGGSFVNPLEGTPDDWIKFFKQVEAIDFDIVSASHTQVGTKADVALFRNFLEDLMAGVTAGVKAGKTVEELEASDMLSQYRWLLLYEARRNASIEDAYKYVQKTKTTATR
jgi:glyoxylase-like metal-dependent hydrolase (beta-lactamase superfamily II)